MLQHGTIVYRAGDGRLRHPQTQVRFAQTRLTDAWSACCVGQRGSRSERQPIHYLDCTKHWAYARGATWLNILSP
jgi:hypothetical protein